MPFGNFYFLCPLNIVTFFFCFQDGVLLNVLSGLKHIIIGLEFIVFSSLMVVLNQSVG